MSFMYDTHIYVCLFPRESHHMVTSHSESHHMVLDYSESHHMVGCSSYLESLGNKIGIICYNLSLSSTSFDHHPIFSNFCPLP